jgi:hypothetical protein
VGQLTGQPESHGFGSGHAQSLEKAAPVLSRVSRGSAEHFPFLTTCNPLSRESGRELGEQPVALVELTPRVQEAGLSKTNHFNFPAQLG